ncbi:MAG: hypothetical protein AAFX86_01030 [Pseudomonadota bacterium]
MTLTALTALPGLAAGFLWSRDWARAVAELRHAEQVARRLLIAEAGRLIVQGAVQVGLATARHQPSIHAPSAGYCPSNLAPGNSANAAPGDAQSGAANATPSFALFEPLPDPLVLAGLVPTGASERLATLAPAEQKPRETRGLFRRISALQAVLDDPAAAARRMARFLLAGRAGQASAIPPGHAPAYRRSRFLDWSMDVLLQAHAAARRALNQGWRGAVPEQPG